MFREILVWISLWNDKQSELKFCFEHTKEIKLTLEDLAALWALSALREWQGEQRDFPSKNVNC